MPDLNNEFVFNEEFRTLARLKMNDPTFTYKDWGNEDLKTLRSEIRDFYRNEQKGLCCYCREVISLKSASNAQVEHIIPKSKNRKFIFTPKNMCTICADCNEIKRNKEVLKTIEDTTVRPYTNYPSSKNAFIIYHPHFEEYKDHIFKVGDLYIDLSKKGSYTIYICELNRKAHEFGIEPEQLTQSELKGIMQKFIDETDYSRAQVLFDRLRNYFIKICF